MKNNLLLNVLLKAEEADVEYVSWKNNHEIELCLKGRSDLDLLVNPNDEAKFISIILENGFVEAKNKNITYPNVYHFYYYCSNLNVFFHIHLYTKMITGESHTKGYHFPIEQTLIKRRVKSEEGVFLLSSIDQKKVFLLRHAIKISSLPSFLLYLKEKESYKLEYESISKCDFSNESELNNSILDSLDYANLERDFKLNRVAPFFKVKWKLCGFSRLSAVEALFTRYSQIIYRVLNKTFFRQKKVLGSVGKVVAITGLDGAGKSTTVNYVSKKYGKYFDVRTIHVGVPKPTIITVPFRLLLKLKKVAQKNKLAVQEKKENLSVRSVLVALRYCILAYERFSAIKKARRYADRGYLVILDRYPSLNMGVMDSRRIVIDDNSSCLIKKLAKTEDYFYSSCSLPDLLINLVVPVDVSIERNQNRVKLDKETDEEIIERYRKNSNLKYNAYTFKEVNMNRNIDECMSDIMSQIHKMYNHR
ncbi:TPA: hypothetical protein RQJ81_004145 [Vibrio vulnificus]|nr:hypothetical protein [Vibrio vulnificus]HDY8168820.1 hypothetical protein [Vibrio vulnificus]